LNSPGALAVDPVGNLYVSHSSLELPGGLPIRRISTDGTISTYGLIPPGGNCPTGCVSINSLAVAGTAVYATFGGLNAVFALNGQTTVLAVGTGQAGFSGDGGPPTSAQLFGVGGVALDSFGDLVITDSGNQRIRLVAEGRPRHQPAAH
jgi:hypothetical protein